MRKRTVVRATALGLTAFCFGVGSLHGGAPALAASHQLIDGSGSSWSANAVNQWIADVQQNGLRVVYSSVGSAQGRKDFAYGTNDFAVSDIGYQGQDPVTHEDDTSNRPYAYLPIVAGGTAFPYQVRVGGQLVRNIRLSGLTLAKIFTNQIKNWNDPAITKDNNGRVLPSLTIIPVVHSEGSGSTYQFTRYLSVQYQSLWKSFAGYGEATEYFPRQGTQIAQNGSDGAMNFISSKQGNGAIGYDEYSYAVNKDYPVAKVLNTAGYYALPNQYNVAVGLTKAIINKDKTSPDYLLQNLDKVYTYNDSRVYPLSSYSYLVEPTGASCSGSGCDPKMNTAKRQTLADYLYYSVCEGQAAMGRVGYSPLPINLVQASFEQVNRLKDADPNVDLTSRNVTTCHNPTFIAGQPDRNYLAEIAPKPPTCDRQGAGPCTATVDTGLSNPGSKSRRATTATSAAGPAGNRQRSAGTGTAAAPSVAGPAVVDPTTGQLVGANGTTAGAAAVGTPSTLAAASNQALTRTLAPLCALLLLVSLVAPPLVNARARRRETV